MPSVREGGWHRSGGGLAPPLELRQEVGEHLPVRLGGEGLGHLLVYLVEELGAVVNHLFEGEVLQELAVAVAVLAVVVVDLSVGIVGAVGVCGEGHAAALAELGELAGLEVFRLGGEGGFVGGKGFGVLVGHVE